MSIESGAILVGGTTSTTGGTSTSFIVKGDSANLKKVYLDDSSEYVNTTSITFTGKDPIVNSGAPNGYTQQRSTVKANVPLLLDNGNYTMNTVNIELACDPETSDAEKVLLISLGVQLLNGTSFADFWKKQSMA
jgi:hypothetical protein